MVLSHLSTYSRAHILVADALRPEIMTSGELHDYIASYVNQVRQMPMPIQLERGVATIPLQGIDVPFHSSHLRTGVHSYRKFLQKHIHESNIEPEKLVGKFVPNVMAERFSLEKPYVQEAYRLTQSSVLKELLDEYFEGEN